MRTLRAQGDRTKAQRAIGARWVRCDILLFRGKSGLTPLTRTAAPFLSLPIPDNQARCVTTKFFDTTCDAPHFLRVTGVVKLKGKAYPGKAKVQAMADKKCASHVTTNNYYYRWPSKKEWQNGYKWVLCESKTRR
jgi:Septum formation